MYAGLHNAYVYCYSIVDDIYDWYVVALLQERRIYTLHRLTIHLLLNSPLKVLWCKRLSVGHWYTSVSYTCMQSDGYIAVCTLTCTTCRKAQLSTHDSSFSLLPPVIAHRPPLLPVAELHTTALVVLAAYQTNISFLTHVAPCRRETTQQEDRGNSLQCARYKHHSEVM